MTIQIEFHDLLAFLGALTVLTLGSWWAFGKLFMRAFTRGLDARFGAMEKSREEARARYEGRFERIENDHRDLDRSVVAAQLALPREYVRREDHIRFETVIQAKLDSVAAKIDLVAERQRADSRATNN